MPSAVTSRWSRRSAPFSTGCGREHGGPGVYAAHGVVEDVDLETAQVLIDHEAVDGLMEAMTMSFVVPDAEVLAAIPGEARMHSGRLAAADDGVERCGG